MRATDIQEEEIRTSINLSYVEGNSEKLGHILRSHKIRSTFYTEMTLHKLFCKPKDRVATENKNNIIYEIDCSTCQAVYFGEPKQSLKSLSDEHKRFFFFIIINWDSLHARLNSHYEAWSYKKKSTKKITGYRKSV